MFDTVIWGRYRVTVASADVEGRSLVRGPVYRHGGVGARMDSPPGAIVRNLHGAMASGVLTHEQEPAGELVPRSGDR